MAAHSQISLSKNFSPNTLISIDLPASKSQSNRVLIIQALAGTQCKIENLSEANDTKILKKLLSLEQKELNVEDAGTAMRFMTAYLAVKGGDHILEGTERMSKRPIKLLVESLRSIGAPITYLKEDGFPPIRIKGLKKQVANEIKIRGDISSQYISALLMIAPYLPEGLIIKFEGEVISKPYIDMTRQVMHHYGVDCKWEEDSIAVKPQTYQVNTCRIEPDWTAASYWYSIVSLAESVGEVCLKGLCEETCQGDIYIKDIMKHLGVKSTFTPEGLILKKMPSHDTEIAIDFSNHPDLAQTVAVICAVKGVHCTMSGLESLRIKETDRIKALQNELYKTGTSLKEVEKGIWYLRPHETPLAFISQKQLFFNTYDDHRMAMAFAPLAMLTKVSIENPHVVRKSYPCFWEDLGKAGINWSIS